MKNTKTVFKFFSIPQYRQEEEFLSNMSEKGWKFSRATLPGFYHFEKTEPGQVTYRLDYNQEGISNKDEYIQMFSDCGWEYVCDFVGYSYFRKAGVAGKEKDEIFCDDESRLDMMKRVFRGKIIPLITIFLLVIIPQLFTNTLGYSGGGKVQHIFAYTFLGLALLYIVIFMTTAVHFYKFEKQVSGDSLEIRLKYVGIFAFIAVLIVGIAGFFWSSYYSIYRVTENENGYVVDAERLNTSVEKEYDLKKGDTIVFHISEFERGKIHMSVRKNGKKPIFFGDFYNTGYHSVEIQKSGHYEIEISGNKTSGNIEVTIK